MELTWVVKKAIAEIEGRLPREKGFEDSLSFEDPRPWLEFIVPCL
jgi:hypothetical protein